jgi:hypothetical protein
MSINSFAMSQEKTLAVVHEVITSLNINVNNYIDEDGSFNMGAFIEKINDLDINDGKIIEIKSTQSQ